MHDLNVSPTPGQLSIPADCATKNERINNNIKGIGEAVFVIEDFFNLLVNP